MVRRKITQVEIDSAGQNCHNEVGNTFHVNRRGVYRRMALTFDRAQTALRGQNNIAKGPIGDKTAFTADKRRIAEIKNVKPSDAAARDSFFDVDLRK
jgi:hypothetical protein